MVSGGHLISTEHMGVTSSMAEDGLRPEENGPEAEKTVGHSRAGAIWFFWTCVH